jgi:hypothetical protein
LESSTVLRVWIPSSFNLPFILPAISEEGYAFFTHQIIWSLIFSFSVKKTCYTIESSLSEWIFMKEFIWHTFFGGYFSLGLIGNIMEPPEIFRSLIMLSRRGDGR